jgi:hypothetical protein
MRSGTPESKKKLLTYVGGCYNIVLTMKNIIEETLSEFAVAYPELNFGSQAARTMLATEINLTLLKEIEERTGDKLKECPEDIIREGLRQNGFTAGDSGYCFQTGVRDIDFYNEKTGDTYVITIQQRDDEDTFEL